MVCVLIILLQTAGVHCDACNIVKKEGEYYCQAKPIQANYAVAGND